MLLNAKVFKQLKYAFFPYNMSILLTFCFFVFLRKNSQRKPSILLNDFPQAQTDLERLHEKLIQ